MFYILYDCIEDYVVIDFMIFFIILKMFIIVVFCGFSVVEIDYLFEGVYLLGEVY